MGLNQLNYFSDRWAVYVSMDIPPFVLHSFLLVRDYAGEGFLQLSKCRTRWEWHRRPSILMHTVSCTFALRWWVQRLYRWRDLLHDLSVGRQWLRWPIDPHTSSLLSHQCTLRCSVALNYKDPWFFLRESQPEVSNLKKLKHLLSTFPQIFEHFRLLEVSQLS